MTHEASEALRTAGKGLFDAALERSGPVRPEFKPFAKAVGTAAGLSGKALFKPLRAALTGRLDGPEMERLWKLMGPERIECAFQRRPLTAQKP